MFCPTPLTQAAPWAESEAQVLKSFKTDLSKGLTDAQVTKLRAEYGTNELDKPFKRHRKTGSLWQEHYTVWLPVKVTSYKL